MTRRRLLLLATLALPLLVLSCAPHDDAPPAKGGPATDAGQVAKKPLDPIPEALDERLKAAVENVHSRELRTDNGFWTIFHNILGTGPDTTLRDPDTKKHVNALDYLCTQGEKVSGLIFVPVPGSGVNVQTKAGDGAAQGHQDQFIAEMAQWGMPLDRKIKVGQEWYTFADFARHSKMQASVTQKPPQELSWAIIIVAQYYPDAGQWTNNFGEKVSLEDIARHEVDQPIDTAACGGTHRLFGLTWAYHLHLQRGGKTEGVWKDVAARIAEYKQRAKKYQNPDGSFSTAYLAKKENNPAVQARIGATGHVFEWLALALTDEELREPWVQSAASALAVMILENASNPIDSGATYHATHGLHIYRRRAFGVPGPRGLLVPPPPKD